MPSIFLPILSLSNYNSGIALTEEMWAEGGHTSFYVHSQKWQHHEDRWSCVSWSPLEWEPSSKNLYWICNEWHIHSYHVLVMIYFLLFATAASKPSGNALRMEQKKEKHWSLTLFLFCETHKQMEFLYLLSLHSHSKQSNKIWSYDWFDPMKIYIYISWSSLTEATISPYMKWFIIANLLEIPVVCTCLFEKGLSAHLSDISLYFFILFPIYLHS